MEIQPKSRTLLITGGAGFIGSNFVKYLLKNQPGYTIINLDLLTYAGSLENLQGVADNEHHIFIQGDIRNPDLIGDLFETHNIDSVIHFAAESHVDNSIESPDAFIKTNIEGTFRLLEAARDFWTKKPFERNKAIPSGRFHHISTDEVYGTLGDTGYFDENSCYAPNSPYSASKAASDFLVRSYNRTYGLNTVISNCSNNYGPGQHDEKLIPTIIRKALHGEPIPIYGAGDNIRDWLFVEDHCRALERIFMSGRPGETYCIGGGYENDNMSVARKVCALLDERIPDRSDSFAEQITLVEDRPGHDFRYAIDSNKMMAEFGWKPQESFDSGLSKTIDWYLTKYDGVKS